MPRLGTWTTIDCPIDEVATDKAQAWLAEQFSAIGASVRKVQNSHEFGQYPSFEIDAPSDYQFHDIDDCQECPSDVSCIFEDFADKANAIDREYSRLFSSK